MVVCRTYKINNFIILITNAVVLLFNNEKIIGRYENEQDAVNDASHTKLPLYNHLKQSMRICKWK